MVARTRRPVQTVAVLVLLVGVARPALASELDAPRLGPLRWAALEPALDSADSDEPFQEIFGTTVRWGAVGACVAGLFLSHTAQAIWGPLAARSHNRKLRREAPAPQPLATFVAPGGSAVYVGLAYRF